MDPNTVIPKDIAKNQASEHPRRMVFILLLVLLALTGFNLRSVLLETPPILPLMKAALGLNYTQTSLMTGVLPLVIALGAIPCSFISARVGAKKTIFLSIIGELLFSAARTFAPDANSMFFLMFAVSFSVTLGQTTLPLFIQSWFPNRIGQVTAIYSSGLMVGEILSASFTYPFLYNALHGWRPTFIFWTIPVLFCLAAWIFLIRLAPEPKISEGVESAKGPRQHQKKLRTASDITAFGGAESSAQAAFLNNADVTVNMAVESAVLRFEDEYASVGAPVDPSATDNHFPLGRTVEGGMLLGSGSAMFFILSAWLPVYYQFLRRSDGILALSVLTVTQLIAGIFLSVTGERFTSSKTIFVFVSVISVAAAVGWYILPMSFGVVLSGVFGMTSAALFIMGQARILLKSSPKYITRMNGVMLSISYSIAFLSPLIGGIFWDVLKTPEVIFAPLILVSLLALFLSVRMKKLT